MATCGDRIANRIAYYFYRSLLQFLQAQKNFCLFLLPDDLLRTKPFFYVKEKQIVTRPDTILRRKNSDEYPMIIDAKYKREENNADFYQVIAYALAIPSSKACCLIYPTDEEVDETPLTLQTKEFGNLREEIKLYPFRIDLRWNEVSEFSSYIQNIKQQLRTRLEYVISP